MCPCKAQLAVPQEKPCCLQFKPPHERRAQSTERGYKRKMRKKMRNFYLISSSCLSGWTRGKKKKKMLTCSLAVFSASNSFCNLSDLSSAPSACSCKNLIFRLTASSDVVPAIVYCSTIFFLRISWSAISEKMSSSEMTSLMVMKVRKLSGDARCSACLLFVQEVPLISK